MLTFNAMNMKTKKMTRQEASKKAFALFGIYLMISLTIVTACFLRFENGMQNNYLDAPNGRLKNALISLIDFLLPSVAAAQSGCCQRTNSGATCQDTTSDQCAEGFVQTSCANSAYCKPGCCYIPLEGLCEMNTPQQTCLSNNGTWDSHADCSISQCTLGCCLLGDQASFVTSTACSKKAALAGLDPDFRDAITTEYDCISAAKALDRGACVIWGAAGARGCKFGTREECSSKGGEFHQDVLCSASELGTACAKQASTGCIDSKEEVYWMDSCGNPENIYDSDKDKSWNGGRALPKEESCSSSASNVGSKTCGNCNYALGSTCARGDAQYGDYACRDLSCNSTTGEYGQKGVPRNNGESWCVFDQYIDPTSKGLDAIGSRYWRHYCFDGQEYVEPCADFRQELCKESIAEVLGVNMTSGSCLPNRWRECSELGASECEENYDCYWFSTVAGFKADKCVPRFPPGFEFWQPSGTGLTGLDANSICSAGSAICEVEWEKAGTFGSWEVKENADCKYPSVINALNQKCHSLGDCGGYVNYGGYAGTAGFSVTDTDIHGNTFSLNHDVEMGSALAKIIPASAAVVAVAITIISWSALTAGLAAATTFVGGVLVGGVFVGGVTVSTGFAGVTTFAANSGVFGATTTTVGTYGVALAYGIVFGIAAYAAFYFGLQAVGVSEVTAQAAAIAAGTGVATGVTIATLCASGGCYAGWWGLAAAVVVWGCLEVFGVFSTKKTEKIEFSCSAWQPPKKGEYCEDCNKDPQKPCSEYRCKSLGAACELLNAGTGNESCTWMNKNDKIPPKISSFNVGTPGYSVQGFKPGPFGLIFNIVDSQSGGCVKAFTPLSFTLGLNELAQCKIDSNRTRSFDDMHWWMGGLDYYITNHTHTMLLPPLRQGDAEVTGPMIFKDGQYTLYIRCNDANGNEDSNPAIIKFCVDPSPDTTPPRIEKTNPVTNSPVSFGVGRMNVDVLLNEPAECRWDTTDSSYNLMANNATECAKSLTEITPVGADIFWKCALNLTGIQDGADNAYYFRCKDQPLETNESKRNSMNQAYRFVLKGSDSLLKISSIEPTGIQYGDVNLTVETEGGCSQGDATCSFTINADYSSRVNFFETGQISHLQTLKIPTGDYTYYVQCVDSAQNIATGHTSFSVQVDTTPPRMARVYHQGSTLEVLTNEQAQCSYSTKSCNFIFEQGTPMDQIALDENSLESSPNVKYYIKCKDNFGNTGCIGAISAA